MTASYNFQSKISFDKSITIADGETVSAAVDIGGSTLIGFNLPAGLEGTAISFQASTSEGGTYFGVYDVSGNIISFTIAASRYVSFDYDSLRAVRYIKLVAGTSQTGDVEIGLILKAE